MESATSFAWRQKQWSASEGLTWLPDRRPWMAKTFKNRDELRSSEPRRHTAYLSFCGVKVIPPSEQCTGRQAIIKEIILSLETKKNGVSTMPLTNINIYTSSKSEPNAVMILKIYRSPASACYQVLQYLLDLKSEPVGGLGSSR